MVVFNATVSTFHEGFNLRLVSYHGSNLQLMVKQFAPSSNTRTGGCLNPLADVMSWIITAFIV